MKKIVFLIGLILYLNFVAANLGYDNPTLPRLKSQPVIVSFTNTTPVNSSTYADCWTTTEGVKCDVADITYDEISGGNVNALGYTGFFNYIQGVVGQLSIDGDPWYLGGTDLQLGQELEVFGSSNLNDTFPRTTLANDLGSGALRWRWLYVQNISAENIDTYTIHTTEGITTDGNVTGTYFVGDGSQLTGIQQGDLLLFFLNESSDVTGNKTLSTITNGTEITLAGTSLPDGDTLLGEWITNPNVPSLTYIPEGNWLVHVEGKQTGGTKLTQFYYKIYKTNSTGGNEVLIGESGKSETLISTRTGYDIWTYFNELDLNTTDRIKIKGYAYVSGGGSAPSVEAYIQGASHTRLEIPVGSVSVESFVPYTNAIKDVDLGDNSLTIGIDGTEFSSSNGVLNFDGLYGSDNSIIFDLSQPIPEVSTSTDTLDLAIQTIDHTYADYIEYLFSPTGKDSYSILVGGGGFGDDGAFQFTDSDNGAYTILSADDGAVTLKANNTLTLTSVGGKVYTNRQLDAGSNTANPRLDLSGVFTGTAADWYNVDNSITLGMSYAGGMFSRYYLLRNSVTDQRVITGTPALDYIEGISGSVVTTSKQTAGLGVYTYGLNFGITDRANRTRQTSTTSETAGVNVPLSLKQEIGIGVGNTDTYTGSAFQSTIDFAPVLHSGSINPTIYGIRLKKGSTVTTTGTPTYYAFYNNLDDFSTNWNIYNDAGANNYMGEDNSKTYFGTEKDSSISYDGTNMIFVSNETGSGDAWFSRNVSATGFITRTSVYDKEKGSALDLIKDSDSYLDEGDINHSAFYGYTQMLVTDYDRPEVEKYVVEVCEIPTEKVCEDVAICEYELDDDGYYNEICSYENKCYEQNKKECIVEEEYPPVEVNGETKYIKREYEICNDVLPVCKNVTETRTIYPYQKAEDGIELGKEIDVLRQSVFELKTELCRYNEYVWC